MAKEKASSTAIAPASNAGPIGALVHDELAALGEDFVIEDDGLSEVGREDFRISAYVINMKAVGKDGRKVPEDEYYDTINETTKRDVNAAFLHLNKTNLYAYYDETLKKSVKVCSSRDRKVGVWRETGEERQCEGCPDAAWKRDDKGKPTRNCGPVYNLFAIDRDTQMPFVVRFKRSSMPAIKAYLQKHFIGRRVIKDKVTGASKRVNYPLFAFQTQMGCRMSDDGKYALPVLQRGEPLPIEEILTHQAAQNFVVTNLINLVEAVEQQVEDKEGPEAGDTSFDTNKYGGGEGQDIVDTEGTSTAA